MSCSSSSHLFQEAIDHCRWKTVLHSVLTNIDITQFQGKEFEEIIYDVYSICENIKGIGMLTIYDITSAICRYYKINIDKVFIIGNGPKRAIKLLRIKPKIYTISKNINMYYVDISEVVNAFDTCGYKLNDTIRSTKNADMVETFICNWQKTIN
jgi:hypothetical protein